MKGGGEGPAIVPGEPGSSRLVEYVGLAEGHDRRMPPKGPGLSKIEISILETWIADGAPWPDSLAGEDRRLGHWAFQPLRKIQIPDDGENPIDFFVREKQKEVFSEVTGSVRRTNPVGSKRADRRTLIRRLSFNLHGLPPSPSEVSEFEADQNPHAYARLVERLLASPRYGERFARHWLDIAHYADTHGFERDKRRDSAWRYRDYVIDAFNSDKPYDVFLKEQIAGDVIFPDDDDAAVATGFLAAGPWDFVGQVETKSPVLQRAARALDLDDMVTQVMTSTMGMTVNCARCHDHKLDPISQEEYFRLVAVFAGVERKKRPISERAKRTYEKRKKELEAERDKISYRISQLSGAGLKLADIVGGGNGLGSGEIGSGIDPRSAVVQTRKFGALGNVKQNHFVPSKFEFVDGVFIANGLGGEARIPVSSTGVVVSGIPATSGKAWDHIRNGPVASQHSPELDGIDFTEDDHSLLGIHANAGITFDLRAARKAMGDVPLRFKTRVGYFGAAGENRADVWVFVDGQPVWTFEHLRREDGLQNVSIDLSGSSHFMTLLVTDGDDGYGHDQVGFGNPTLVPAAPSELTSSVNLEIEKLEKQREGIERQIKGLGASPEYFGLVALKEHPEVRMQRRGEPEAEFGDAVLPGALSALSMLDANLGSLADPETDRRKALAEWVTDPENPLTARVIVNRIWHWHFGKGIVDTPSDFGMGGGEPSHPELLDWLAAELIRNQWSLKSIHRLILNSETYRQESRFPDDDPRVRVDAGNRFLWRQNARRIEAEMVRDSVLLVSGKLNENARGGPGFEDFNYTEAYAPIYEYITADRPELWRRSIYRYVVRTTPNRFLTTLDCPDPANFTPKRLTTTTPLQSLALLNNDFMLQQARHFADRIRSELAGENDSLESQVITAFKHAFGREPQPRELEVGTGFLAEHGLFEFCRFIFNANEFLYVD